MLQPDLIACLVLVVLTSNPQPPRPAPLGAAADYHVHVKGDLTLDEALRRSRESGITYGIAVNGGVGSRSTATRASSRFCGDARQAGLRRVPGRGPRVGRALQPEGARTVRLRLHRRDDLERRQRQADAALDSPTRWAIADPEAFMDALVDRATRIFADEPIDLYVNPTYVPDQLAAHYDRLWTPARMKRIVDGLAANGIGDGDQQPPPHSQRGVHQARQAVGREVRLRHEQRGRRGPRAQRVLRRDDRAPATCARRTSGPRRPRGRRRCSDGSSSRGSGLPTSGFGEAGGFGAGPARGPQPAASSPSDARGRKPEAGEALVRRSCRAS